jgi:hypothetical protein
VTLLSQTNALASLLDTYARGCRELMRRGADLAGGGVDKDELGQVVEELFNARDAYGYGYIDRDAEDGFELDI